MEAGAPCPPLWGSLPTPPPPETGPGLALLGALGAQPGSPCRRAVCTKGLSKGNAREVLDLSLPKGCLFKIHQPQLWALSTYLPKESKQRESGRGPLAKQRNLGTDQHADSQAQPSPSTPESGAGPRALGVNRPSPRGF